jgi:hypothetical protein
MWVAVGDPYFCSRSTVFRLGDVVGIKHETEQGVIGEVRIQKLKQGHVIQRKR